MKKVRSLLCCVLVVTLLMTFSISGVFAAEGSRLPDKEINKMVEALEEYLYIKGGYIVLDYQKAEVKGYTDKELLQVKNTLDSINKKVESGVLWFGVEDEFGVKEIGVEEEVSIQSTETFEIRTNIWCHSKSELHTFWQTLVDSAPSTWHSWVVSTALSVIGLFVPHGGGIMTVAAATYGLTGFASNIETTNKLANHLILMDSHQFSVVQFKQEYRFPTISSYLNDDPDKIKTTDFIKGTITNFRVPHYQLYLYR